MSKKISPVQSGLGKAAAPASKAHGKDQVIIKRGKSQPEDNSYFFSAISLAFSFGNSNRRTIQIWKNTLIVS
jgi:hypothetical protein